VIAHLRLVDRFLSSRVMILSDIPQSGVGWAMDGLENGHGEHFLDME
jgi:hypothetical protein